MTICGDDRVGYSRQRNSTFSITPLASTEVAVRTLNTAIESQCITKSDARHLTSALMLIKAQSADLFPESGSGVIVHDENHKERGENAEDEKHFCSKVVWQLFSMACSRDGASPSALRLPVQHSSIKTRKSSLWQHFLWWTKQ